MENKIRMLDYFDLKSINYYLDNNSLKFSNIYINVNVKNNEMLFYWENDKTV